MASMLEGYTSERLRSLVNFLDDKELSDRYLDSTWIDPKRMPMEVLSSLNSRNLHKHIKTVIQFVIENVPNPTRMSSQIYSQKRTNLINQLKSIGTVYKDGVLKTSLPNPSITVQNIRDIIYLLKQNRFVSITPLLQDYLSSYASNPNTSLGKLRIVFENLINAILTRKTISISLNMREKIKQIQKLVFLPTLPKERFLNHFYGIYACLSEWGSHGSVSNNFLLNYITTTSIGGILIILQEFK